MMIKPFNIHKSYVLTQTHQRVELADLNRLGVIFQNQTGNGTSNIWVCSGGDQSNNFNAVQLTPSGTLYEDILAPHGDIWAWTDSAGTATLTLVLKY